MHYLRRLLPNRFTVIIDYNRKLKNANNLNLLENNKELIDSQNGKRCFILGNGPSLNKERLDLLKDEIVFCVNDIYAADFFDLLQPSYYLFFDPAYYDKINELIKIVNQKSHSIPTIITGCTDVRSGGINNNILYLMSGFDIDHLKYIGLHIDGLLPYYCTVVQYALSVAISMGFSEIYLLGCDCTGILNHIQKKRGLVQTDYCYDTNKALALKQVEIPLNEHAFYEWYHIFKSYRLLNEYAKKRKIKIIDLTYDGILDVFPREKLESVFCR